MNGILFSDLESIAKEKFLLSEKSLKNYWQTVKYETAHVSGALLSTKQDSFPKPITLEPKISGWHKIYVGIVTCINEVEKNVVNLKLSSDETYTQFRPSFDIEGAGIEENFWKCADLTDEALIMCKLPGGNNPDRCMLGWLRFEKMTDDELRSFQRREKDFSRKNIYATNDMHNMPFLYGVENQKEWNIVAQSYEQSDVEWLSVENLFHNNGKTPVPIEEFSFSRAGDKNVQKVLQDSYNDDMNKNLVKFGHSLGIKMCISQRMGEWCMPFPVEDMYFDNEFFTNNPDLCCVDRDGVVIPAMSYAFNETQDYMINLILNQVKNGFDAVELMFHRGIPFVLFEKPFCELFKNEYGEDPCVVPWKDERIIKIRCEIITSFIRRLKRKLNDDGYTQVRLHLRGLHSIYDNRLLGIDIETLAQEKLVDAFIAHPLVCRECLDGDVWQEADRQKIELEKYTKFARESTGSVIYRHEGFAYVNPNDEIYKRIGETALTEKERISQWVNIEKTYGTTVYFDIMPRFMSPNEYKKRICEIYELGGTHISFWDTYNRVRNRHIWNIIRNAGDFDFIKSTDVESGGCSKKYRFIKTGNIFNGRFRPNWGA